MRRGVTGTAPKPNASASVRVICRCRPTPLYGAPTEDLDSVQVMPNGTTVEVTDPANGLAPSRFLLDAAYGDSASTSDVFTSVKGLARAAAAGAHAAVIAYGPSGSGKTHTMYGNTGDPGLVPRLAVELLSEVSGCKVRVSVLELHNDGLVDLLAPGGQRGGTRPASSSLALEVRGGTAGSMAVVDGAEEVSAEDPARLLKAIQVGLARRSVATTAVNETSSRSHLIVVLSVGTGRLTLVDLAGLERVKRSCVEGRKLRETQAINKSLQSLGDVVEALRQKSRHVPVRNSCLARILAGALGGGAETAVVVCVSPSRRDEAVAALCFAERVRRIPAAAAAGHGTKQSAAAGQTPCVQPV